MNRRNRVGSHWVGLGVVVVSLAGAAAVAQPSDVGKTNRLVNSLRVNLGPLAEWFQEKQAGSAASEEDRPLKAWKLVRVQKVIETGTSWVVEAQVEGKSETNYLKNPPQREFEEFNRLKAQHDQLLAATNQLAADLQRLPGLRRELEMRERDLSRRKGGRLEAMALRRRVADLGFEERGLRQQLEAVREDLRRFDAKGYDLKKPFTMDCLALRTGETARGKAVFDRGVVK
jgi:hypothetical protein